MTSGWYEYRSFFFPCCSPNQGRVLAAETPRRIRRRYTQRERHPQIFPTYNPPHPPPPQTCACGMPRSSTVCAQDAYYLAECLADLNGGGYEGSLSGALKDYERRRKPDTAAVLAKSVFVGAVETLDGPAGEAFRDNFFFGMWKAGVAEKIFMDGAMPKV